MLEATLQTVQTPSMPRLLTADARAAGFFGKLRARSRAHQALRMLTIEQLADVGIDPALIGPPRPTVEIKRGLLTNLASMR